MSPWRTPTVALTLLALAWACTREPPASAVGPPVAAASPRPVVRARLKTLKGDVKVKRAEGDDWVTATEALEVRENDKVRTAKGASVQVQFPTGSMVTLGEDGLIAIAETRPLPNQERTELTVLRGRVDAELSDGASPHLSVSTPSATIRAGREIVFQ